MFLATVVYLIEFVLLSFVFVSMDPDVYLNMGWNATRKQLVAVLAVFLLIHLVMRGYPRIFFNEAYSRVSTGVALTVLVWAWWAHRRHAAQAGLWSNGVRIG